MALVKQKRHWIALEAVASRELQYEVGTSNAKNNKNIKK